MLHWETKRIPLMSSPTKEEFAALRRQITTERIRRDGEPPTLIGAAREILKGAYKSIRRDLLTEPRMASL